MNMITYTKQQWRLHMLAITELRGTMKWISLCMLNVYGRRYPVVKTEHSGGRQLLCLLGEAAEGSVKEMMPLQAGPSQQHCAMVSEVCMSILQ